MDLKTLSFKKKGVLHTPINYWTLSKGETIVIFQGNRGQRPDLDFIVKYKKDKSRLRAPSHTHWIVDLIMKKNLIPSLTIDFINDWIDLYDRIQPFKSIEEMQNYSLIYSDYFKDTYSDLDETEFSVEFVSCLLELFCKCEKQTDNAFMFKNLLKLISDYCGGKKDFYQVISYSKRV